MIPTTFRILNLTFYTYGLIVGIALVVAISLIEKQYNRLGLRENYFNKLVLVSFIFSIIGARIWHVATDFYLYKDNLMSIFYIWNGGLSIFGGILGGVVGLYFSLKFLIDDRKINLLKLLDIAVFGLPFGQAIGRLGNYVNQELYGLPSNSIFKIYISPENRLIKYKNIDYYHPLFFYEMIAMISFGGAIYYLQSRQKLSKTSGKLFLIYILYYSIIRLLLDFIRVDKTTVFNSSFGVNQVILVFIIVITSYFLIKKITLR